MLSGRITSARVVGTLFSIDPAMSVIIAAPILRQTITAVAVLGVIVVSLAGALLVWPPAAIRRMANSVNKIQGNEQRMHENR